MLSFFVCPIVNGFKMRHVLDTAQQCYCPSLLWVLFVARLLLQVINYEKNNSLWVHQVFTETMAPSIHPALRQMEEDVMGWIE